ncbi:uncharacterized protein EHS24_003172 [Apiotrichum porosum]|uniref:Uncharacterized protein n=1 Tax=Apiotrichum porosum TaxID=105984 RepID=A0A427XFK8_9TREE|nr:uncharacterized protein EHS24_003172 [Apiotrichum porosum]RSH77612.1 hypothetical protein EHS24_003172 [Apiotrichum porosum]
MVRLSLPISQCSVGTSSNGGHTGYLSYGRVTPQEIPQVIEETILQGKIVPGLLRSGAGIQRGHSNKECGILS